MNEYNLGVIGYGNMAYAIVGSAIASGLFSADQVGIFDPSTERQQLAASQNIKVYSSLTAVTSSADIILLSVKPQQIDSVLSNIREYTSGKCVVSIAAGISGDYLKSALSDNTYILRVMPNTPIMLGKGASALAAIGEIPQDILDKAAGLFSCSGVAEFLPDEQIDAITAVNGSSPGFFFKLAQLMTDTAAGQGIDPDVALRLIAASMSGAAEMLTHSGKTPEQLCSMVCSKGGTTIAMLDKMLEKGLSEVVHDGMIACTRRALELGGHKV